MAFRAFFALPAESFRNAEGQHTNAVHGFTSMLINLVRDQKPTHVAVAFDVSDETTHRKAEYSEYKGGRNETPAEFRGQIDLIKRVMHALGIRTFELPGHEADDILATLATQGRAAGMEVLLVSGDRDTFQLVNDHVFVLYPRKGVSDIPRMDAAAIEEKYFVPPARYPDLAALVGESADNLPGVPGVGPKTAAKWIAQYDGLEGVIAHADEIKGKAGESLRENLDSVERNRRLNRLLTDLDLEASLDELRDPQPDTAAIESLFDELEFRTLRTRVYEVFATEPEASGEDVFEVPEPAVPSRDELPAALARLAEAADGGAVALAVRAEPAGERQEAVAVALVSHGVGVYVPLDGSFPAELSAWLADPSAPKSLHEYKEAAKALRAVGAELAGVVDDASISGYLIEPDRRSYALADLAQHHLDIQLGPAPAAGQLALDFAEDADGETARALVREAAVVHALHADFTPRLAEVGAAALLADLELPLARVLLDMEWAGIAVSTRQIDELMDDLGRASEEAAQKAYAAIGHEVNLGSPKQLQTVLFEELELPRTKKIKTGYTTDAASLKELLDKTGHPFLAGLMAHRESSKLRQMVETLKKSVTSDSRIHTTYAQNIAATGRLSSNNPNLQNIPIRSEEGRRVRDVFVVGEGYESLLAADYSQIEMRIMAHLSNDAGLIQAYREGEDLHRFVGARIFHVEPADVTSEMRSKVKAMSYGLAYGLTSFGLSKQLEISVDEARNLMKDYFDRFGGVRDYLRGVVEQARKDGYTSTIFGRRRYLPDLNSTDRARRELAERVALNSPIQGSAADIIKRAMLGVERELRAQGLASRLLLQIHDELVVEVAAGEEAAVRELVVGAMGSAAELTVPLDVQVGVGRTWNEAGH
ncbi:DNA polymerase I [Sinomonas sp. JGH33]|uniref:DNA polymerase I n=2 Tax=Sinomonas terricola TaxID=3110330 RepID=A0ABU5T407_9MICC|nr:DNA polymerase I [Sinomonas sp. JGH33]MEA5454343.1 DNA polymerase I [Sinomonas sp. JGH33]